MIPHSVPLPLPENCAVRLIDLDWAVDGLIAVDETGFVNIYLNARLPLEARERALRHELAHYYRDDLFNELDIRQVEQAADADCRGAGIVAMDGAPLAHPAPVFDPAQLRPVGRGLYLPLGDNKTQAAGDLARLRAMMAEACLLYDVAQRPPLLPAARLREACDGLDAAAIAFIGWAPARPIPHPTPVVMQFCRDVGPECQLNGAVYYAPDGQIANALATVLADHEDRAFRVAMDFRQGRGGLRLHALHREVDGTGFETLYGG